MISQYKITDLNFTFNSYHYGPKYIDLTIVLKSLNSAGEMTITKVLEQDSKELYYWQDKMRNQETITFYMH